MLQFAPITHSRDRTPFRGRDAKRPRQEILILPSTTFRTDVTRKADVQARISISYQSGQTGTYVQEIQRVSIREKMPLFRNTASPGNAALSMAGVPIITRTCTRALALAHADGTRAQSQRAECKGALYAAAGTRKQRVRERVPLSAARSVASSTEASSSLSRPPARLVISAAIRISKYHPRVRVSTPRAPTALAGTIRNASLRRAGREI